MNESVETNDKLSERYADALLPLTITFGIFALVGVIGNGFVLAVFSLGREYRNTNFRVFVICLAIIDFLTSIFLIPSEMMNHRNIFAFENLFMCKAKCFFIVWAGIAAALSLFIICVDRFIKVVLPLKKQISPQLALRLCILLSFVVPIILSIPGAVMCGVLTSNKTNIYNTSTEVYVCETEPKYAKYGLIYKFTCMILLVGLSFVSLIMYILIGRQIVKHRHFMPESPNVSGFGVRKFPYKTLIWFILTLVFVIAYLIYIVLALQVWKFNKKPQIYALFSFFYRLYFVNNIINPFIYALLDPKFRKASKRVGSTIKARLCCCLS